MAVHQDPILALAAQIVSAHVGSNAVASAALPSLIRNVYSVLAEVEPALPRTHSHLINDRVANDRTGGSRSAAHVHDHNHDHGHVHGGQQTVFADHLICLEDGLSMKMLKRHLLTVHGLTPEEYREKWGLPNDYPMVASSYAKLRSSLAIQSGLGKRPESLGRKGARR